MVLMNVCKSFVFCNFQQTWDILIAGCAGPAPPTRQVCGAGAGRGAGPGCCRQYTTCSARCWAAPTRRRWGNSAWTYTSSDNTSDTFITPSNMDLQHTEQNVLLLFPKVSYITYTSTIRKKDQLWKWNKCKNYNPWSRISWSTSLDVKLKIFFCWIKNISMFLENIICNL